MAWIFKKGLLFNSIEEISMNANNFAIYPNPARNQLFIERENLEDCEFSIFNLLGEKVISGKLNENIKTINISFLPSNVYILRIANETVKFIKSN
jgi:hypothetical protein